MRITQQIILMLILITIIGCVKTITFDIESDSEPSIVIIGEITTAPGPYTIEIYQTVPFFDPASSISTTKVNDADVTLYDLTTGRFEKLINTSPGIYSTDINGIRGEIGHRYFIGINAFGKNYQSLPAEITTVPELDSIAYELTFNQQINSQNEITEVPTVDITISFNDPLEESNFLLWKWSGTSEVKTFPELYINYQDGTPTIEPLPCSEGINCFCCTCWVDHPIRNTFSVYNDVYTNGNYVQNFPVISIPANATYFDQEMKVVINQYSLDNEAYSFWKGIISNIEDQSTLFATPAVTQMGNIMNINDPDEIVLGYFFASDVTSREIKIEASQLDINIVSDSIRNDCRVLPNSSNFPPGDW
jgi:hypothetical protein